jgi:hypothetical protein
MHIFPGITYLVPRMSAERNPHLPLYAMARRKF